MLLRFSPLFSQDSPATQFFVVVDGRIRHVASPTLPPTRFALSAGKIVQEAA